MPKVYLNENQRLSARLSSWVYGEMKIQKIPQRVMAEEMGVTQAAFSQKLRGCNFSFDNFLTLVRVLKPETKDLERLLGR